MPVSCDPVSLAEAAACFECLSEGQVDALFIYLLCQWANL